MYANKQEVLLDDTQEADNTAVESQNSQSNASNEPILTLNLALTLNAPATFFKPEA